MTADKKTAVYIRLSSEDDNVDGRKKLESDSVSSQRILLKFFVMDNLGVYEEDILEYVDDGITGTHFILGILYIFLVFEHEVRKNDD